MKFTKEEIRSSMLLYAITDRMWLKPGQTLSEVTEQVLQNGATFLQIREKDLEEADFERESAALKAMCARYRVPFVVNDSVEIALECDADGVHVGQSDIKGRDIRAMLGPDKILGISAGCVAEAIAAQAAGADYIGVGAVFHTSTKKDAKDMTREQLLAIRNSVSIPVVAIGGISKRNILELSGSGVDGVAVVSALFGAENPGSATAELKKLSAQMVAAHE
ncbi:MAG: thiamine phosphate synthase [Oscillibacter sp.]|jgi:thiamine-phosphate pyrophosphorylase|nr:thiamine phosphate synthase [Oscillibacter sp.]